jgi:hypothetical protein
MTSVDSVECPQCHDTIFSRAVHDMRWCSCHNVAIDGGREYTKITYTHAPPEAERITVTATSAELYLDWARGGNKYGKIPRLL